MSRPRPTLAQLRSLILDELDDHEWTTFSELTRRLRLGNGDGWIRVALTCERLVSDGDAELKTPGAVCGAPGGGAGAGAGALPGAA